jgi:hypothetical protein
MNFPRIFFSLAFSFLFFASALGQNMWKGSIYSGGQDWHNPTNWSKGHVPTDLEEVIIPDLTNTGKSYPVIQEEVEIQHLRMYGQASLSITSTGVLYIELSGSMISHLDKGAIHNQGRLFLSDYSLELQAGIK